MTVQSIMNSLRIIPRDAEFLDRKLGSRGEIFFDQASNTLRLYDGVTTGGIALLRADLSNSEAVIGAVLGDVPPTTNSIQSGTLWFNTSTGKLYIYYNDGTSLQWVQPMSPSVGGGSGGGGSGTVDSGVAGKIAYYPSTGTTVDDLSNIGWANSTLTVTGAINVTAQKNYVRFHWDTLTDLNNEANPTTWHGMLAHVHDTGRVYFAHAGAWTPLANFSDVAVTGLLAGNNITLSVNNGVYTIDAVAVGGGGGGGISLEDAQDGAASLFATGTHTGISFSYNDATNNISATVGTVTLGTGTSGNYVASVQTGSGITGGSAGSEGAEITLTIDTAVVSTLTGAQTLLNKTISGASNTITNIGNNSLSNSSITINGQSVSLGGSITVSGGAAGNLDSLTDVIITSPSLNQVLKYNGTNWINDTDATTGGAGAGTVTSVSITSANGFAGSVATASSTPAITISTSITGVLKGNGTAISAATAGTDYQAPIGTISGIVKGNGANALTAAVAGTDYQSAQSVNGIVKSSGTTRSAAVAGTDYQSPITLTTTGSSGAATFSSNILNIPQYSGGGGASDFNNLTDATTAGLTIDKIYLPAITRLDVTANGTSAYRFDQYGSTDDPTITAINATTIAFNLTGAGGHPFLIQDNTGTNYNTGLVHVTTTGVVTTGSSAQGKSSGTLYWKIPDSISGNYRYQCASHAGMVGTITVKNFATL